MARQASAQAGWSARLSTAVEWVWSMYLCGKKACSSVSTDGLGAPASIRLVRWKLTMSSSLKLSRARRRRSGASRQAGRLDRGHVPAAALNGEHLDRVADEIGRQRLHRGVAAAMEDETLVAAEQARGIDAQGEVAIDAAFGIVP